MEIYMYKYEIKIRKKDEIMKNEIRYTLRKIPTTRILNVTFARLSFRLNRI